MSTFFVIFFYFLVISPNLCYTYIYKKTPRRYYNMKKAIDCEDLTIDMVLEEICSAGTQKKKCSSYKRFKNLKGDYKLLNVNFSMVNLIKCLKSKGIQCAYYCYSADSNDFCLSVF